MSVLVENWAILSCAVLSEAVRRKRSIVLVVYLIAVAPGSRNEEP